MHSAAPLDNPDGVSLRSPLAPGNHGAAAQGYREAAIAQLVALQVLAGGMEEALRAMPDDDAAFEYWSGQFMSAVPVAGHFVDMFRFARECRGGRQ